MPSEILLDATRSSDYATIVVLRLTNKHLLRFVDRYADQLAFRRTFSVSNRTSLPGRMDEFYPEEIRADNSRIPMHKVDLDATDKEQLTSAAIELQSIIGPHAVQVVDLSKIRFSVKQLVEHIPALRHAAEVYLDYASGFAPTLNEYAEIVSFFERLKRFFFWEIPIEALVAFLQNACTSQLVQWVASAPPAQENVELDPALEELIFRSFYNVSNLVQGGLKKFMFTGWNLRWDFLRRIIEALDDLQRTLTIVVSKPNWAADERLELGGDFSVAYWRLPLDPTSFEERFVAIVDFLQNILHEPNPWIKIAYFSKRSGVVVFVQDEILTITNNPIHIELAASLTISLP